jgi:hypothetical protein
MQVYPERVSVDDAGLSLTMGLTVAAVDPRKAPRKPARVELAARPAAGVDRSSELRLHFAAEAIGPLTDLLIQADVARIHVNDVPNAAFARFADRALLAEAIPDMEQLPEETEIWSELILTKPLSVSGGSGDQPAGESNLQFSLPTVVISTAIKTDPASSVWTPYAESRFSVSQQAHAGMQAPSYRQRYFELKWKGNPQVAGTARFAPDYAPKNSQIDADKLAALFAECW